MKIRLLAFATAADALGAREIELEVEPGMTVAELLGRLEERAPELASIRERLAIAVDGRLVGSEAVLEREVEVALLPPVSGGDSQPAVQLVTRPIEPGELSVSDPACGAEVVFVGRVREASAGRDVDRIDYQGYQSMAERRLAAICSDLSHAGVRVRIIHRLGVVPVGEPSVAIAARAPHRREAFEACSAALERLKREAPIWKLEYYRDGSASWREEEALSTGSPSSTT